ncbi:MAG TPA: DUF188 domain-containing protein [Bacillota bacterium]|nr:DUF188 domain-containing protein [Bacillota bacterium]
MKLIVDADACPREALEICRSAALEYAIELLTVSSFNHNISGPNHTTVGNSPEEADFKIANMASRGDIVVTQDMGLAALALARGAAALNTMGREYVDADMALMLEQRAFRARYRRGGGRTPGPRKRTAADDESFRVGLATLLARLGSGEAHNSR